MKKLLLTVFILVSTIVYSQDFFTQEGQVVFKVKSNHYYTFKVSLKANTQYMFKLNGESLFNFKLIEPSGNEGELQRSHFMGSNKSELIVMENIMEKGIYIIKIYSISDNVINMVWGEY